MNEEHFWKLTLVSLMLNVLLGIACGIYWAASTIGAWLIG